MNKYNTYYKDVFYEGVNRRMYNEKEVDSLIAFYSETQITLIKLIKKFNFKVFYFQCDPKTNFGVTFNNQTVNLFDENVMFVKKLLSKDMYKLYSSGVYEVIYTIPKLNSNKNYYFDFLLIVNDTFSLNLVYDYNFNINNILSVEQIYLNNITYNWIEKIFENRVYFYNNGPWDDKNYINDFYDSSKLSFSKNEFFQECQIKNIEYDTSLYFNLSSPIYYKNFNQNLYLKNCFMLLDAQIWSSDRIYCKIKNNYGHRIGYFDLYDINPVFLTNFAEIAGAKIIKKDKTGSNFNVENQNFTYCSLADNYDTLCVVQQSFNKKAIKTGKIDLSNLEVKDEEDLNK